MPKDTVISNAEWEKRRSDVRVSNDDLNALVMNYLVTEVWSEVTNAQSRVSHCQHRLLLP